MNILLLGWGALLIVVVVLAQQEFGLDVAHLVNLFFARPFEQRLIFSVVVLLVLWLVGIAFWQAIRLSRNNAEYQGLRQVVDGYRHQTVLTGTLQRDLDLPLQHLVGSDPEENMLSLQKRIAEAERLTALQESRNEASDMNSRLENVRRRQYALREQLGGVIEKRRAIEPLFSEIKDRQKQLEFSLQ